MFFIFWNRNNLCHIWVCTETDTSNVRFVQNDEIQLVLKLFCCVCVLLLIYCLLLTCHETRGFNTLPSLYSSFNEWGKKKLLAIGESMQKSIPLTWMGCVPRKLKLLWLNLLGVLCSQFLPGMKKNAASVCSNVGVFCRPWYWCPANFLLSYDTLLQGCYNL